MKIAHVGLEIAPSPEGTFIGGLVKNLVALGALQVTRGHDVHVFTSDVGNVLPSNPMTPFGRVEGVGTAGSYGSARFAMSFIRSAASRVRQEHRKASFDIIHIHSAYAVFGILARLLRDIPAPKVFSLYSPNFGLFPGHDCNGQSVFLRRLCARLSLREVRAIIVPSRYLLGRVIRMGVHAERVRQVVPALTPQMFSSLPSREEARRQLGLPADARVLLYLGNYSDWKGIDELLRALPQVTQAFPGTVLLTAWGERYQWPGNRRASVLAQIDQLGLGSSLHQVGLVPDVRTVIRASDLLVLPPRCTCKVLDYPLSILEAMACERPVVSTNVGGIPELLDGGDCGDRGILVEPRNVQDLVEGIGALLGDPDFACELGLRGASWVRERCHPEGAERAVEAVYTALPRAAPRDVDRRMTTNVPWEV